jgi:RNA polymerase sigma factor (sigma-70 family)
METTKTTAAADLAERDRLIDEHRWVPRWIVNREYRTRAKDCGLDVADVDQEALIGLWMAVERWDAGRGPLAPYAGFWIRKRVTALFAAHKQAARAVDAAARRAVEDAGDAGSCRHRDRRRAAVWEALDRVDRVKRNIVILRFGLEDGRERTLTEIALAVGFGKNFVRDTIDQVLCDVEGYIRESEK